MVNKDEDILAVAAGLSEDLSTIAAAAATSEESEDSTEETITEETEVSEEETEVTEEVVEEESSTDDSEEADVQEEIVDSEIAEEPVESSTEKLDDVQEEVQEHDDLKVEESNPEHDAAELTAKFALLEEENARLKSALHLTLVERVVDTKISLGYESVESRENLITEHVTRTASSLADSLRDLAKLPAKKNVALPTGMPEVTSEAVADLEDSEVVVGEEVAPKVVANPAKLAEELFVDALMGRRKL